MAEQRNFGKVFKYLRDYHGYSQKDVAACLNVSPQAYSNYENNKRTPDLNTMITLADFYRIDLDRLVHSRTGEDLIATVTDSDRFLMVPNEKNLPEIPVTAREAKALMELKKLSPKQQEDVLRYIRFVMQEHPQD
ncbi:MAG: helix-turn-helix domain-containing protein [Lachnospiraceae bacterium]